MRGTPDSIALDMLARAMAVVDSAGTADQVVLDQLGRTWQLDAAAVARIDPPDTVTTTARWPDPSAAEALSIVLREHGHHLARTMSGLGDFTTWQPPSGLPHQHVLLAVVRPEATGSSSTCGTARVATFARAIAFSDAELSLWKVAREPLAVLWALADRMAPPECHGDGPHQPVVGEPMTPREIEVLELLADGLLARSIATQLELSPRTVHRHLANIYRKLGVHDRMIAVNLARERGLIGPAASEVIPIPRGHRSLEGSSLA
jgi:DNA-binding CsgD family transcriptional regulator